MFVLEYTTLGIILIFHLYLIHILYLYSFSMINLAKDDVSSVQEIKFSFWLNIFLFLK